MKMIIEAFAPALRELIGLFVEDGSLAVGILIWLAVFAGINHVLVVDPLPRALLLFLGLALLLLENVRRSSRKK